MFAALTTGDKRSGMGDWWKLRFRPGKLIPEYYNSATGAFHRVLGKAHPSERRQ